MCYVLYSILTRFKSQSQSQNYLFQIDQEGTFERQSKYNNINNVCLLVSPLVALFARSKV
uniref:SFRICE_016867 n=1 Tax=Spodoptera frugiperda TaxID=7108 RepID=A0A2H1VJD7_SPOFR